MQLLNFSKGRSISLIFITGDKAYRLDIDKNGAPVSSLITSKVACANTSKLAGCIAQLSPKDNPLGHKTWLLYEHLPTALLSIPSMQVEGVEEAVLLQALQFEWESLTGQSALDVTLAFHKQSQHDDMSYFWVSEINQLHFEDSQKALKKAGSQLAGLLHPAGLPFALQSPEQTDWLRIEYWAEQVVALSHTPDDGLNVEILPLNIRMWPTRLKQWLEAQGAVEHTESLLTGELEGIPQTHFQWPLNDPEILTKWLRGWASLLVKKTPLPIPVLQYRSTLNHNLLLMAGGGGAALLICLLHAGWNWQQGVHYQAEIAELQKVEASLSGITKTLADNRSKRDQTVSQIAKLKADTQTLPNLITSLQQRPAKLLEALAKGRPDNLIIEEISVNKDTVIIHGVSLDATSANDLVKFLEKPLASLAWSVAAPSKTNMSLSPDGGPWEFEIALTDLGINSFIGTTKPQ